MFIILTNVTIMKCSDNFVVKQLPLRMCVYVCVCMCVCVTFKNTYRLLFIATR